MKKELYEYCLRLGDSALIHGQRLAEWCSNGPILEEDIALSNISLDLFGQARMLLSYAAEIKGEGATEDTIAFRRNEREYFNTLLTEQPNGHFGDTVARDFMLSVFNYLLHQKLSESKDEQISAIAQKAVKEYAYHMRHFGEWVVRLGDGTEESKNKIQKSFNDLWMFKDDMFVLNEGDRKLVKEGVAIDTETIRSEWDETVNSVLNRATLKRPEEGYQLKGSREGVHTEHLGHLLCEMQYLQRAYPDAEW